MIEECADCSAELCYDCGDCPVCGSCWCNDEWDEDEDEEPDQD